MQNKLTKFLGVYWALNVFGNCFSPVVVLDWKGKQKPIQIQGKTCYPARAILVLRTHTSLETTIYWRGGLRFDWNSAHLARRFGEFHDTDFGGYHQWGHHMDL
jgi:hypothetical protein